MNQIIFQSKNLLYNSSFDFNLFQNNSQEYTSTKTECLFPTTEITEIKKSDNVSERTNIKEGIFFP